MNWRHRVEKAITGKFSSSYDGSLVVGFDKDVKKVIDKCRIKYSGYKDMKHTSGNYFNTTKYYDVNGTTYKVIIGYIPDQSGNYQLPREGKKAFKSVEKMVVFKDYNQILSTNYKWDYKRSDDNKCVCWKFIRGGY